MKKIYILLLCLGFACSAKSGAAPKVVASIVPVHSLVAAVLQGVTDAQLLLPGGASPHDYALRPSDMRTLHHADIVFWIGPELETALARPLAQASNVRTEALLQVSGLTLLPLREGGIWEVDLHDHDAAEHEEHEEHADWDAHIWLNPANAQRMVAHIATVLSTIDPAHSAQYMANANAYQARIMRLSKQLIPRLAPVKDIPYIVFHDAYHYFEQYFDLQPAGSITLHPDRQAGARRVQEIRARIENNKIRCVFSEPQFQPALVQTLIVNSTVRSATLDPLGAKLTPGPDAYLNLLDQLAQSLNDCLKDA